MYENRKRGTVIRKLYNQNNKPTIQQNKSIDTTIAIPKMKQAYKIHQTQKYQNPKNETLNQNMIISKYHNKHQRIEQYILIYITKTINTEKINKSHALLPYHNITPRNQHWPDHKINRQEIKYNITEFSTIYQTVIKSLC